MRQLGPVLDFLRALWALDHALQSASKRMETTLGVTGPQLSTLRVIHRMSYQPTHEMVIGRCQRSHDVIEPRLKTLEPVAMRWRSRRGMVRQCEPVPRRPAHGHVHDRL